MSVRYAITGINLSSFRYGIVTAQLTLTDLGNNSGSHVTATVSSSANSTVACETQIGWLCSDGTVYAGISPDGNKAMYVARCDNGQTWNGSTCSGTRVTEYGATWVALGLDADSD